VRVPCTKTSNASWPCSRDFQTMHISAAQAFDGLSNVKDVCRSFKPGVAGSPSRWGATTWRIGCWMQSMFPSSYAYCKQVSCPSLIPPSPPPTMTPLEMRVWHCAARQGSCPCTAPAIMWKDRTASRLLRSCSCYQCKKICHSGGAN